MENSLQSWLHDSGSLIKRLRQYQLQPQIKVLRQGWYYPQSAEQICLGLKSRRYLFVREVEILHQDHLLLFARTAIPALTLKGREKMLMRLGKRSLGSILFSCPQWERSAFEFKLEHYPQYAAQKLWERQSLFYWKEKSILLTEVFLPFLVDFIKMSII